MRFWIYLILVFSVKLTAQNCNNTLSGSVFEKSTDHRMENVYLFLEETNKTAISDKEGYFEFENMCAGDYHIKVSHIGCENLTKFVTVNTDTQIEIQLEHHTELLNETVIHAGEIKSLQQSNTLNNKSITENANKSFGDILSNIQGVSSIKSGSSISKPIIHGLVGNRVGFIDNGVPLASQQWGNDHAPEIDPSKADHISVLKGVAALEYATTANAIVIVEPFEIKKEPHLHGKLNYIYDTNSRGHSTNVSLSNYNKIVGFHLTGTFKKNGDARAPDYFLTNTGSEQKNVSLLLDKEIGSKLKLKANYSYFDSTLGILAGAFSGTLRDLEAANSQDVPSNTNANFSYNINQPNQEVSHHLAKVESKYKFSNASNLHIEYAYQKNERLEFDQRRTDERTGIPELELNIDAHYISSVFKTKFSGTDSFKLGAQYTLTENKNIFGTGVFPLVPDYNSDEVGFFSTYTNQKEKWSYEFGARLSLSSFNVATAIRVVERFQYDYTNYSLASGITYNFNHDLKSTLNVGYATRGAKTNELFSFGVHQGVGAFEKGSYFFDDQKTILDEERNFKVTWSWDYHIGDKLFIQTLFYANPIDNYIYLAFDGEIFSSRGAFNAFHYEQTDGLLLGQDFSLVYNPVDYLDFTFKYAYLYGEDLSENQPLINMSPNNASLLTNYLFTDGKRLKNNKLGIEISYTAKQNRFVLDEEVIAPPSDYTLINLKASSQLVIQNQKFDIGFQIENITNKTYRNYLNRLRYFADEQGINVSFRLGYQF